jgi:hypothetical protein
MVPSLQTPMRVSGARIECFEFTQCTGLRIVAEYPQPIDKFLAVRSSDLDFREGPFGVLGFGHRTTDIKFAVVLGFINFMGPCCKVVRDFDEASSRDKLQSVFEQCQLSSLSLLSPSDTIRFPVGEPGAISMWKEDIGGKVVAVIKFYPQLPIAQQY